MSARRLDEEGLALLGAALRDGEVVGRYRDKIVPVPGSSCSWWRGAVSGRGHGRFWYAPARVEIAHRFAFALVHGVKAAAAVPVLGHRCDNPLVRREALVDRVEVRDLHRRPVAAGRLKLGAA